MNKNHTSQIWKISKEELEALVSSSDTLSKILKYFGLSNKGGNYQTLRSRLEYDNIDTAHITTSYNNKGKVGIKLTEDVVMAKFAEDNIIPGHSLKKYLRRYNLIPYICTECTIEDNWNNKLLVLTIDHINGDHADNRLENLRYLCPNCHSQTPTFAGRSLKKKYFVVVVIKEQKSLKSVENVAE